MFACKCLNIFIQANNDVKKIDINSLNLLENEKQDEFFKKDLIGVVAERITKQQQALVLSRQIGQWVIHKCLNCLLDTHAVHKDKGASCVLISDNLLTGVASIQAVQNSSSFSKNFGIVINLVDSFEEDGFKISASQFPENLQVAYSDLHQKFSDILRKEGAETEERIRRLTEIEHTKLDMFRDQIHKEYNSLLRVMLSNNVNEEVQELDISNEVPMSDAASIDKKDVNNFEVVSQFKEINNKQAINKPKHPAVTNLVSKNSKRSLLSRQLSQPVQRMESDDAILFPMDGMDESPSGNHSDVDESDTDDSTSHDEGIHIPRLRAQSFGIAKSLPMNIPVFHSNAFPREDIDTREDYKSKEDLDIAASIKALAKSVHGDDVFGDLPRPRFSTQI